MCHMGGLMGLKRTFKLFQTCFLGFSKLLKFCFNSFEEYLKRLSTVLQGFFQDVFGMYKGNLLDVPRVF